MAADMSLRLGWIEESIVHRTIALLEKAELPTRPPQVLLPPQRSWQAFDSSTETLMALAVAEFAGCVGV